MDCIDESFICLKRFEMFHFCIFCLQILVLLRQLNMFCSNCIYYNIYNPTISFAVTKNLYVCGRNSRPVVQDCLFEKCGLGMSHQARGVYRRNRIRNAETGIAIRACSDPIVRQCVVTDCFLIGIIVTSNSLGTIDSCNVYRNVCGMVISHGAHPLVRRNNVKGNKTGIIVRQKGQGLIRKNTIAGNMLSGVEILTRSIPVVLENHIGTKNSAVGVYMAGSKGRVRRNIITGVETGILMNNSYGWAELNRIEDCGINGICVGPSLGGTANEISDRFTNTTLETVDYDDYDRSEDDDAAIDDDADADEDEDDNEDDNPDDGEADADNNNVHDNQAETGAAPPNPVDNEEDVEQDKDYKDDAIERKNMDALAAPIVRGQRILNYWVPMIIYNHVLNCPYNGIVVHDATPPYLMTGNRCVRNGIDVHFYNDNWTYIWCKWDVQELFE